MKDIEIIDLDYSGLNPEYRKEEVFKKEDLTGVYIVPDHGPFFGESVRVIQGSTDLEPGTHYSLDEEIESLTKLFGKPVYQYVILKDNIAEANIPITIRYQKVGKVQATRKQLLKLLEDMVIAGSNIDFDNQVINKPLTYYPSHHLHDIKTELTGWGDFVRLFAILKQEEIETGTNIKQEFDKFKDNAYKSLSDADKTLYDEIYAHIRNVSNPHGMNKTHINLPLVDNVATATLEQDAAGTRGDLRSTVAGLKRAIEDANPETEEFIVQNELPFGYYGSGIYLPPPISGSFEGLGADQENSAVILESNGWLVSLVRCFDGRTKSLYFVYNKDFKAPNAQQEWVHSYVKYTHPTITALGLSADYVVAGSNSKVLMIGHTAQNKWWVCNSNSTFNPANHDLKEITFPATPPNNHPGYWTIHYCNNWIYLTISTGLPPANNTGWREGPNGSYDTTNLGTYFYRFPTSKLTDPAVKTITWEAVNMTFQNLDRQWFNNQPAVEFIKLTYDSNNLITSGISNYNPPISRGGTHRRRVFISVANQDVKNLVRFTILMVNYTVRAVGNDSTSCWKNSAIHYTLDTNTNTLTLDPSFQKLTYDVNNKVIAGPQSVIQRQIVPDLLGGLMDNFTYPGGSWCDGVGWIAEVSGSGGIVPWGYRGALFNKTGDPGNDYESVWGDIGLVQAHYHDMKQKSPFGFAGSPRFYTDLYDLKSGLRQYPIEVFIGNGEANDTKVFYRTTEGGSDDTYSERPNIQSQFFTQKIWGRKTNTGFGRVVGIDSRVPIVNAPGADPRYTRQFGMMNIVNRGVSRGTPTRNFNYTIGGRPLTVESDDTVILPVLADWELNNSNKTLFVTENPAKCVAVPKSIWDGWARGLLASVINDTIEYYVSIFIGCLPGNSNVFRSSIIVTYHTYSEPTKARIYAATFYWRENGVNVKGVRKIEMTDLTYNIKIYENSSLITPSLTNNVFSTGDLALNSDLHWGTDHVGGSGGHIAHAEYELITGGDGKSSNFKVYTGMVSSTLGYNMMPILNFSKNGATENIYMTYLGCTALTTLNSHWGAVKGIGLCRYRNPHDSGGSMCLLEHPTNSGVYLMLGAVYVEGNWSVFVGTDVNVTFNGRSMQARRTNFDLRDFGTYRSQTFYLYCVCKGAYAEYEMTKTLSYHNPHATLVAKIVTNDLGVSNIERYQPFTVAGFPLIRSRDAGIPYSSGTLGEAGTFSFIKRSELYNSN